MITLNDIAKEEYPSYYTPYLSLVNPQQDLMTVLDSSLQISIKLIESINKSLDFKYAVGKWSIGEVIQHNIDTERVFAYRALRFMRGDTTALSGFDQDIFVDSLKNTAFAKAQLQKEMETTRNATIELFRTATEDTLLFKGTASSKIMTARVVPFIIAGHNTHHENIIKERYLS